MGETFERIRKGLEEATEIAAGSKPAPRLHYHGHAFVPEGALPRAEARIAALEAENARLKERLTARRWVWRDARDAEAEKRDTAEARASDLERRLNEAVEALTEAEACMSIVEPRSDKGEYLRVLGLVRGALRAAAVSEGGEE